MQDYQFAPSPNVDAISDKYSSSATYAVGDYCIHDDRLYKCSTAISTAEAWNAAHWTETDVVTEISAVNGDLSTLSGTVTSLSAHIVPIAQTGAWNTYPGAKGRYVYYYEGVNTTTYSIPYQYCFVIVEWYAASRGVARAYRWTGSNAAYNYPPKEWINVMHDSWRGWKNITESQDISSAITVSSTKGTISQKTAYKSGNVVALAFVLTTNTALSQGNGCGITMSSTYSGFLPKLRCVGGCNSDKIGLVNVEGSNFNATAVASVASGTAFWLYSTYICSD